MMITMIALPSSSNPDLRQKYKCKRSHRAGAPSGASFFVCMVEKIKEACYTYKVIG